MYLSLASRSKRLRRSSVALILAVCTLIHAAPDPDDPALDDDTALTPAVPVEDLVKQINDTSEDATKAMTGDAPASDEKGEFWDSSVDTGAPIAGGEATDGLVIEDVVEPIGLYRYAAFGKADPFIPPFEAFKKARIVAFEIPIVSPLQRPLSRLKVAGIWELEDGTRRALILADRGEGVIASVGDPIGLAGKIIEITSLGVMTRQYRIRSDGAREFQDQILEFGEKMDFELEGKVVLEPGKDPIIETEEQMEKKRKEEEMKLLNEKEKEKAATTKAQGDKVPDLVNEKG